MNASSLLARMARLFAAQARTYCLSALIAGALGIIALTAVSLLITRGVESIGYDPATIWRSMPFAHQLAAIFGLVFALWTPILLAARGVSRITADQLSRQPVSLNKVLTDMVRFLPAALIYTLVIGFATMIGSSVLFVPGIVIASLFVLVVPTSVNESAGIFTAFRRGISLSAKVFGANFILTLACCLLVGLIVILRIIFLDRFLPDTRVLFALRFTLTYIPALLILVLANICFTLIYNEVRKAELPPPGPSSVTFQP